MTTKHKIILAALIFLFSEQQAISQEVEKTVGPFSYQASGTAAKLLPDISVLTSFTAGYFNEDPVGDVGHDPARTGFTFQEVELALQSVVDPYFRGDIFLAFLEEGVELEEGYFTTLNFIKGFQLRGGKLLLPFGRQNQKHLHLWNFADNALVNKYLLGPEGLSELGIEVSYLLPTPFFLQVQGTLSNGDNGTSFGGGRKEDFLYQGRISTGFDLTENLSLLAGFSAALGFNDTGLGNETNLYGGDLYLRWKPSSHTSISWQTEYLYRRFQVPGALRTDGGLYSYVNYQFLKRWSAGLRYDQMGMPEGIVTKEYKITPVATFDPTEFSRIRLQYAYDKTEAIDAVHSLTAQIQFNFGTHAAHAY